MVAPGYQLGKSEEWVTKAANALRANATPRAAPLRYDYRLRHIYVRQFLRLVQTPTLILHNVDHPFVPMVHGRFLDDNIADVSFPELPGIALSVDVNSQQFTDFFGEFLTSERLPALQRTQSDSQLGAQVLIPSLFNKNSW